MSKVILFTEQYPFSNGESFLETEIEYLAKEFGEVVIRPRITIGERRDLPNNVKVIIDDKAISFQEIISAIFNLRSIKEGFHNLKYVLHPKGFFRLLNFSIYGRRVEKWVLRLDDTDLTFTTFYCYWTTHAAVGMAWARKKNNKLTFVTRAHRWDAYLERNFPPYLPFRGTIFEEVKKVFVISFDLYEYLILKYPKHKKKFSVSRLGVEGAIHISKHVKTKDVHLVSCSYLTSVKRIDRIIDSLSMLNMDELDGIKITWTHFGDGPLKNTLIDMARSKIDSKIEWNFVGNVSNKLILEFYLNRNVDLFMNTSESEGIPVSIMEAQANKIPVAAVNTGGVSEIVNSSNGFLLDEAYDPYTLSVIIEHIAKNKDDITLLRNKSYDTWKSLYNASKNYEDFVKGLNEIMVDMQ